MKVRMLLVAALAVAPLAVPAAAGAQECADDDYSTSCQAQRRCEQMQEMKYIGQFFSCTQ